MLTAKSRVAPLKTLTIPRFELSGARRLASLISSVQKALTIKISQIVYWTDSTIVIQWIMSSPHMLKTFVANRVAELQTKTNISDWRHVSTADNPADLISRGQMPKEFLRPSIWKNGPEWLQQIEALIHLQCIHLSKEIRTLQKDPNTAVGGKLQRLNPFLDNEGILRIGGRLNNSPIPFHQKHPIILPKSLVTELIIDQVHRRNHHSGTQATLYVVRQRYRLVDGRNQVWRTIKRCVRCCRTNPPSVGYLLGHLPESRITESRPLTNIGIDSCCPLYIKEIPSLRDHNRRKVKVYVAIFICLTHSSPLSVGLSLREDIVRQSFRTTVLTSSELTRSSKNFSAHYNPIITKREYIPSRPTNTMVFQPAEFTTIWRLMGSRGEIV